ncbi:MAG: ATP-dependent zinc metalloprotease FtsH [Clostridia bacterium]|nr:ATP-dependent zinc metalloprotease FtsH [Clostridia bacterium]
MKNNIRVILFYVVLIGLIILAVSFFYRSVDKDEVQYSDIIKYFNEEKVDSFTLTSSNVLKLNLKDKTEISFQLRSEDAFDTYFKDIAVTQFNSGIIQSFQIEPLVSYPWWLSLLPYAILILLLVAMWIYMINQMNGKGAGKIAGFGKARARFGSDEKRKTLFSDVAGADEEKEELREIVEFLKDPSRFTSLGAKIPHGVLLVGPPGTGKTLLAKAVAGEANVPFYSISGSDFVEMYVGVGASRVRDLFDTARKNPAAIVFIDEIDAVGRHRGAGLGGGHDEREQTLNQLLVEMDGFGGSEGIIVMAATNRPDILDPALLRPGRFDRQITVNYPDMQGREDILKVHAKGKPFEKDVSLAEVAKTTVGFTGADLANLLNEAALIAARKGKHLIGSNDIDEATIKVLVGPQKKSKKRTEHDIRLTAFHEAGHAVCTHLLETQDPVTQISIIPGGKGTGGYTLSPPQEDKNYMSKRAMEEEIVSLLGGRVAEQIIFNDVSTGASNDIQRATNLARSMVTRYGMSSKLGPIVYGSGHSSDEIFLGRDFNSDKNYSESTAQQIDDEIRKIVEQAYQRAEEILLGHRDKLEAIADYLIKREIMDKLQFEAIMNGSPTTEELDAMVEEKRKISEEENRIQEEAEAAARKRDEEEARKRDEMEARWRNANPYESPQPKNAREAYLNRLREEEENLKRQFMKDSPDHSSDQSPDDTTDENPSDGSADSPEESGDNDTNDKNS